MSDAVALRYQRPMAGTKFRAPAARGKPELRVDREARLISAYAVITRGEALGHGLWIDEAFLDAVVKAAASAPRGLKSRFTHPGLCSDGMGKQIGRTNNLKRDGDCVRGDLKLYEQVSSDSRKDLIADVLDLAEEDPAAFGASIVFERDSEAELAFVTEHGGRIEYDEWGCASIVGFKSPDPLNAENYPHARLGALLASDIVDEPAANPGGFFSAGDELAARGEHALRFVFGLSAHVPPELFGGIEPARAKAFVEGFLVRNGLSIGKVKSMPKLEDKKDDEPEAANDPKPKEAASDAPPKDDDEEEGEDLAAKPATLEQLEALAPKRAEFVLGQLKAGATLSAARLALKDLELAELKAENAKLKKGGVAPVSFGEGGGDDRSGAGSPFMEQAKALSEERNISLAQAIRLLARSKPELHQQYVDSIPQVKKARRG